MSEPSAPTPIRTLSSVLAEPDRGRRGRRASRVRGQGARGELARCAGEDHRRRARNGRGAPDPGARRRFRDSLRRARSRALAPRDQQDCDPRRSRPHREHGIPRRSAAQHRLGVEARPREPPAGGRERRAGARGRRRGLGGGARGVEAGHGGRGPRSVLRRSGPAQVPAYTPYGDPACRGRGAPARARAARRLFRALARWPQGARGDTPDGARAPPVRASRARRLRPARWRSPSTRTTSRSADSWRRRAPRDPARTCSTCS